MVHVILQIPALPGFTSLRRLEFSYNEVSAGAHLDAALSWQLFSSVHGCAGVYDAE